MSGRVVRYSEAFKMQLIQELESGKLDSIEHARRSYGITGTTTIQKWLKKYGRNDLRAKVVRVEKPDEYRWKINLPIHIHRCLPHCIWGGENVPFYTLKNYPAFMSLAYADNMTLCA